MGIRYGTDMLVAWIQIGLNPEYIAPPMTRRQNLLLMLRVPINLWFQRTIWMFYSLNAHLHLWRGAHRWHKARHSGFLVAKR